MVDTRYTTPEEITRDTENIARRILEADYAMRRHCSPIPTGVMVSWKNGIYIGQIQIIVPDYSPEIVALSKSSKPLMDLIVGAIMKLDKDRTNLVADDSLDLTGRQHVLRRLENRLTMMTPEQTEYIMRNPPQVIEL